MYDDGDIVDNPPIYNRGDIVWVKLSGCWWPGEVKNLEDVPEELLLQFRKPPLVIVKFFDEESYEYVKNWSHINPYNCEKKNDFIKKGMVGFRSKSSHMSKFPTDIGTAEEKTNGNPNILSLPEFLPVKKINYDEIFGSPNAKKSPKPKYSSFKKNTTKDTLQPLITHRRFLGKDDYKAYICLQYPGKYILCDSDEEEIKKLNHEPTKDLNCSFCSFKTKRLEVMILHAKMHVKGTVVSPIKRKSTKSKETLSDSDSESEVIKPSKPKQKKKRESKQKTQNSFSDLLEEWDETDEEEHNKKSHKTKDEQRKEKNSEIDSKENSKNADNSLTPPLNKNTQEDIKNCFDFDEEEEEEEIMLPTSLGRKIPRVIPEKPKPSISELLEQETEKKTPEPPANEPEKSDDLNKEDILRTSETFNVKLSGDDEFIDSQAFNELMQETSVPKLDDIAQTLKPEQNFHDATTVKFPDKGGTAPKGGTSKRKFVTSFEDFETGFRKRELEKEQQSDVNDKKITETTEKDITKKEDELKKGTCEFSKGSECLNKKNRRSRNRNYELPESTVSITKFENKDSNVKKKQNQDKVNEGPGNNEGNEAKIDTQNSRSDCIKKPPGRKSQQFVIEEDSEHIINFGEVISECEDITPDKKCAEVIPRIRRGRSNKNNEGNMSVKTSEMEMTSKHYNQDSNQPMDEILKPSENVSDLKVEPIPKNKRGKQKKLSQKTEKVSNNIFEVSKAEMNKSLENIMTETLKTTQLTDEKKVEKTNDKIVQEVSEEMVKDSNQIIECNSIEGNNRCTKRQVESKTDVAPGETASEHITITEELKIKSEETVRVNKEEQPLNIRTRGRTRKQTEADGTLKQTSFQYDGPVTAEISFDNVEELVNEENESTSTRGRRFKNRKNQTEEHILDQVIKTEQIINSTHVTSELRQEMDVINDKVQSNCNIESESTEVGQKNQRGRSKSSQLGNSSDLITAESESKIESQDAKVDEATGSAKHERSKQKKTTDNKSRQRKSSKSDSMHTEQLSQEFIEELTHSDEQSAGEVVELKEVKIETEVGNESKRGRQIKQTNVERVDIQESVFKLCDTAAEEGIKELNQSDIIESEMVDTSVEDKYQQKARGNLRSSKKQPKPEMMLQGDQNIDQGIFEKTDALSKEVAKSKTESTHVVTEEVIERSEDVTHNKEISPQKTKFKGRSKKYLKQENVTTQDQSSLNEQPIEPDGIDAVESEELIAAEKHSISSRRKRQIKHSKTDSLSIDNNAIEEYPGDLTLSLKDVEQKVIESMAEENVNKLEIKEASDVYPTKTKESEQGIKNRGKRQRKHSKSKTLSAIESKPFEESTIVHSLEEAYQDEKFDAALERENKKSEQITENIVDVSDKFQPEESEDKILKSHRGRQRKISKTETSVDTKTVIENIVNKPGPSEIIKLPASNSVKSKIDAVEEQTNEIVIKQNEPEQHKIRGKRRAQRKSSKNGSSLIDEISIETTLESKEENISSIEKISDITMDTVNENTLVFKTNKLFVPKEEGEQKNESHLEYVGENSVPQEVTEISSKSNNETTESDSIKANKPEVDKNILDVNISEEFIKSKEHEQQKSKVRKTKRRKSSLEQQPNKMVDVTQNELEVPINISAGEDISKPTELESNQAQENNTICDSTMNSTNDLPQEQNNVGENENMGSFLQDISKVKKTRGRPRKQSLLLVDNNEEQVTEKTNVLSADLQVQVPPKKNKWSRRGSQNKEIESGDQVSREIIIAKSETFEKDKRTEDKSSEDAELILPLKKSKRANDISNLIDVQTNKKNILEGNNQSDEQLCCSTENNVQPIAITQNITEDSSNIADLLEKRVDISESDKISDSQENTSNLEHSESSGIFKCVPPKKKKIELTNTLITDIPKIEEIPQPPKKKIQKLFESSQALEKIHDIPLMSPLAKKKNFLFQEDEYVYDLSTCYPKRTKHAQKDAIKINDSQDCSNVIVPEKGEDLDGHDINQPELKVDTKETSEEAGERNEVTTSNVVMCETSEEEKVSGISDSDGTSDLLKLNVTSILDNEVALEKNDDPKEVKKSIEMDVDKKVDTDILCAEEIWNVIGAAKETVHLESSGALKKGIKRKSFDNDDQPEEKKEKLADVKEDSKINSLATDTKNDSIVLEKSNKREQDEKYDQPAALSGNEIINEEAVDQSENNSNSNILESTIPADIPFLSESELVPIEGTLTVMSEKDLADAQVEITPDKVISEKKPMTLRTFSLDLSDVSFDNTGDQIQKKPTSPKITESTKTMKDVEKYPVVTQSNTLSYKSELLDILEGNSNSSGSDNKFKQSFDEYDKKSTVSDMFDFEDAIPSQIVLSNKIQSDSVLLESPKLLERLSMSIDASKKVVVQSDVKAGENMSKTITNKAKPALVPKTARKIVIKTSKPSGSSVTKTASGGKPIILSEQIIRPANTSTVVKDQSQSVKRHFEDVEDVETAFIIPKIAKKSVEEEVIAVTPEKAQKSKQPANKSSVKAKILQQTIITSKGEIIQPQTTSITTTNQSTQLQTDDTVFDINSMPIVISDDLLTPESIQNMPVVLSEEVQKVQEKTSGTLVKKVVSGASPKQQIIFKTTQSTAGTTIVGKQIKPRILSNTTPTTKLTRSGTALLATGTTIDGKPAKYVLVPSSVSTASTLSAAKTLKTVVKKQTTIHSKQPSTALTSEVTNQPPVGNKIMIVTNQHGQQHRVVLTPQQQKVLMQAQTGSKVTKTVVKSGTPKTILDSSNAGPSGIAPKISVGATNIISSSSSTAVSSTGGLLMPVSKTVKTPLQSKKINQKTGGKPQKTILIKNQLGQTVRRIQGTDDAELDRQVAEQLEAIKARARQQQANKCPEIINFTNRQIPANKTTAARRSFVKKPDVLCVKTKTTLKPTESTVPALAPISPLPKMSQSHTGLNKTPSITEKPADSLLHVSIPNQSDAKLAKTSETKPGRPLNQLVIQDALGNQTTITEGQILALPSETVDGQPQSYMLVTLDETGNLTPLNNEALMSLDPSLGLGGDINNVVLQVDQGQGIVAAVKHADMLGSTVHQKKVQIEEKVKIEPKKVIQDNLVKTAAVEQSKAQDISITGGGEETSSTSPSDPPLGGQQLIVTGDPIATQKFLESLSDGTTDLANILANAEGGSVIIQADGQQILIKTNAGDTQNIIGIGENPEGAGNPVFAPHKPNQDILAAALADTDVFQQADQTSMQSSSVKGQLSPGGGTSLYPMHVGNVLETSLTLSSPIMTPLEVPSTNSKKIDDQAEILTQVPKNVDLPITITDPNISQTVAQQQTPALMELTLPLTDTGSSSDLNSPSSYAYNLPTLDEAVGITQKPFNSSMPLLTEDVTEVESNCSMEKKDILIEKDLDSEQNSFDSLRLLPETIDVPKEDSQKTDTYGDINSLPILTEDVVEDSTSSVDSTKGCRSSPKSKEHDIVNEGLCTLGGEMCSSLSEPPPDMFDLGPMTTKEEDISSDMSSVPEGVALSPNSEASGEIPLQPHIVATLSDLKSSDLELENEQDEKGQKYD